MFSIHLCVSRCKNIVFVCAIVFSLQGRLSKNEILRRKPGFCIAGHMWLTHDVFLISLLFRIVSSLNYIQLPLFMINKVNVTLLRQFLGLYCLSKLNIMLTHDVFLISLLFWIVSSLNYIQLPLFMINKVNVTLLRQFLGLYCLSKLTIWLTHNVFLISLLFRIVSSLNIFYLPLFMINKVNVTF